MSDHTESLQIDFDPSVVSFEQLLNLFWTHHSPTRPNYDRQYMSAIWCSDNAQQKAALESKDKLPFAAKVTTVIEPISSWTNAEDYHQKFWLRHHKDLLLSLGLEGDELINSQIATKLNWYSNGNGSDSNLEKDLEKWKLSTTVATQIREALKSELQTSATCGRSKVVFRPVTPKHQIPLKASP